MRNLLWFHVFKRRSAIDILEALRRGPHPPPVPLSKTPENEGCLGITPSVYAYLGRNVEAFGTNGFAVPLAKPSGTVSPFDSGGLVKHIHPVCEWDEPERKAFLTDYSWPHDGLGGLLAEYPSHALGALGAYLDGHAPGVSGPHVVWSKRAADIWDPSVNGWQAWTWEIRASALPAGEDIVCWTCPTNMFIEITRHAEATPADADWFTFLFERYVPGGISQMVASRRAEQEAA